MPRLGHPMATALTDGYVAGLLAGSVMFDAGALVAVLTINARISAAEAAEPPVHRGSADGPE